MGPLLDQKRAEAQPYLDHGYHKYLVMKSKQLYGFDNQVWEGDDASRVLEEFPFIQLTKFEYYVMPLRKMSLVDFERRLKKLAYIADDSPADENQINSLGQGARSQEVITFK